MDHLLVCCALQTAWKISEIRVFVSYWTPNRRHVATELERPPLLKAQPEWRQTSSLLASYLKATSTKRATYIYPWICNPLPFRFSDVAKRVWNAGVENWYVLTVFQTSLTPALTENLSPLYFPLTALLLANATLTLPARTPPTPVRQPVSLSPIAFYFSTQHRPSKCHS